MQFCHLVDHTYSTGLSDYLHKYAKQGSCLLLLAGMSLHYLLQVLFRSILHISNLQFAHGFNLEIPEHM